MFEKEFPVLKNKISNFSKEESKFILSIDSNISLYNSLVQTLNDSRDTLKQKSPENLSEESCNDLNEAIISFNKIIKEFNEKSNLSYRKTIVNNIFSEAERIYELPKENTSLPCPLLNNISEESLYKIEIIFYNSTIPEFSLEDPHPICCLYGECKSCCDESCANKNYPVIFLHGHSFNKDTSADYSLDAFRKIKENLTEKGYIDAGAVIIGQLDEQGRIWGEMDAPIEITGSYFFDVSKNKTGVDIILPSKSDNIDTYSIRLDDLIKTVKYKTGKDKAIIVAHSMGGLVTRRYIQIFGEEDVEKIILITVPNQGIESNIKNYCSLIGSKVECNDMYKDSLLINKLNNAENISIPVYNIIGTGCDMNGEKGDGMVTESSQYLTYATNYYIEGTCNELSLDFLHEKILYPEKYPETYNLISEILDENKTAEIL
jgi:uncharacterized alpha/beta hydrolase family protein